VIVVVLRVLEQRNLILLLIQQLRELRINQLAPARVA
jgi:hypothetical protein